MLKEKFETIVENLREATNGEPCFNRIIVKNGHPKGQHITGLMSNFSVITKESIPLLKFSYSSGGEMERKVIQKNIPLSRITGITSFKTLTGKPVFLGHCPQL
ncbi:hypothetical protein JW698_03110 [Candidatus Wolfebacteria bacterium]|nr:hypothetical protein [Candidatus Wolfebacteria bacterium]